jgi:tetratricopeptide (TPR) repeat protein
MLSPPDTRRFRQLVFGQPVFSTALVLLVLLGVTPPAHAVPISIYTPDSSQNDAPLGETYRTGLVALIAGKLDDAARAFEAAVDADPQSPAPLLGLAEVAFQRKQPDAALTYIKQALVVDPNYSPAHATMGRYWENAGKPKDAEASLRSAIQFDDKALRPRIDLADLLSAQRRWTEAVPLYEACVAIDPQHAGAHYALGLAYSQVDQSDKSRSALENSARLDPKNPLPHVALARWYGGRKEYPQALVAIDNALQRGPTLLEPLLLRGDLLDANGDTAGALGAYGEAAKLQPKAGAPLLRAAMVHHRGGEEEKALPLYLRVIELEPNNGLAMNNLADIYSKREGGLDEAEAWATKAVAAAPEAADAHDTLGWIQRAKGDLANARASLEKATQIDPSNGETLYHLAQVYAEQDELALARKTLEAALRAQTPVVSIEQARKLQSELGV